jgi:hypothetical protein
LAGTYTVLGGLLQTARRFKEAETANAEALALQKQLAADFPTRPELRNDVAGSLVNQALLHNERGEFREARTCLEEALPYHQAALQANPRNPQFREFFHNNLVVLVQANAGLKDQVAAVQAAERVRDLGWNPPANAYDAGCALSASIPILEKYGQLDAAKRKVAVQFYGDQAMVMLRVAVSKGWRAVGHMRRDTDLDPLRTRDDYKKLVADLEDMGRPETPGKSPPTPPNK